MKLLIKSIDIEAYLMDCQVIVVSSSCSSYIVVILAIFLHRKTEGSAVDDAAEPLFAVSKKLKRLALYEVAVEITSWIPFGSVTFS